MTKSVVTLPKLDSRIPEWRLDELRERECPICGNEGPPLAIRPDLLAARKCQYCGTVYISPAPTPTALSQFYSEYRIKHSRRPELTEQYAKFIQNTPFNDDLRIAEISSYLDFASSNILDIGCGAGETLWQFKNAGAKVTGVDLDVNAISFVGSLLKLQAIHGDILEIVIDSDSLFDLIIMFDFIEHPLQPMQYIKRSVELVRNGGFLAVWTPNGSSIDAKSDYFHLRVDLEHMQYLSYQSCFFIAEQLGLRIVHLEGIGNPILMDIELPLDEQRERQRALLYGSKGKAAFISKKIEGIFRRLGLAYDVVRHGKLPQMPPNILHRRHEQYHLFAIFQVNRDK